ncbi:hypothetical protein [Methanobrevibacter sp.]|uniref:hypothetical protein n=1 Tax=Methanobrevibacter sp. TaxID=66852 RepID=UPI0026E04049|nr:hypothetical protein [Methanobrevibacter sp.]MDO5859892.1 hypothetical protein [Methanobrevibacter sp.]
MELKNIILVVIVILIVALIGVGAFVLNGDSNIGLNNITSNTTDNNSGSTILNINTNSTTNNTTVVGDNSPRENTTNTTNTSYKVYVPQSDKYVDVIGEKYDAEVNRWYTYDTDGVRYYNTRIN